MRIFLLSSVYPSKYAPKGTTPVVHYFAKEWVSKGHQVHVFHTKSVFPRLFYLFGFLFNKFLYTRLGYDIPKRYSKEYNESKDGINITHLNLKKIKPHGRFHNKQIQKAIGIISSYIEKEGIPDCFVGHWDNPQLEVLYKLKEKFNIPTCLVFHNNEFGFLTKCYGSDLDLLLNNIDLVGFRNINAKEAYSKKFGLPKRYFIAPSGVSNAFLEEGSMIEKSFIDIHYYIYVGALITRKYPSAIIESLYQAYGDEFFKMTYIGAGNEKARIEQRFDQLKCNGKLCFTGRIPREEVVVHLKESDVFIMISKGEIFGLVYLEAMALGCIVIASRNEGVDGIIEDGINGFLCDAGNAEELTSVIKRIRQLSPDVLKGISNNAKQTADYYSDSNVATRYLKELESLCNGVES